MSINITACFSAFASSLLLNLLVSNVSIARDIDVLDVPEFCDDSRSFILYGNGALGEIKTARERLQIVIDALRTSPDENYQEILNNSDFGIAFRQGIANIFLPEALDDIAEKGIAALDNHQDFRHLQGVRFFNYLANQLPSESSLFASVFADFLSIFQTTPFITGDEEHAEDLERIIDRGRRALTIGYSQGTQLANATFLKLLDDSKQHAGIYSISLLDRIVEGGDRFEFPSYVTIEEDKRVRDLNVSLLGFLADPNMDNYSPNQVIPGDGFGHTLVDHYLDTIAPGEGVAPDGRNINAHYRITTDPLKVLDRLTHKPCHGHILGVSDAQTPASLLAFNSENVAVERASESPSNDVHIDWRGRYVYDESTDSSLATRVLTYSGPSSRYNDTSGKTFYTDVIYRDGIIAYRAPNPVLGAAINTDSDGTEWVIAITVDRTDNKKISVYRRQADFLSFDNSVNVEGQIEASSTGWEFLEKHDFPTNSLQYGPWFFNGDGTEAQTLRIEKKQVRFDEQPSFGECSVANPLPNYCIGNDGILRGAGHSEGDYEVTVLNRYQLGVAPDSVISFSDQSFETGPTGILAVDYIDDEVQILREVNNTENDEFVTASETKWLQINGETLVGSDIITCVIPGTNAACVDSLTYGFSQNSGGYHISWDGPDDHIDLHITFMDLRSRSIVYSKLKRELGPFLMDPNDLDAGILLHRESGIVEYWLKHGNDDPLLLATHDDMNALVTPVRHPSFHVSRFGPSSYASFQKNNFGPLATLPTIRGQYELTINGRWDTAPALEEFSVAVSTRDHILLSGRTADGKVFTYHSDIPSTTELSNLTGINLDSTVLGPIKVR